MSQQTVSPVDGRVYCRARRRRARRDRRRPGAARCAPSARGAHVPVGARAAICERFCEEFERVAIAIAAELTWQMGRPIRFAPSEVRGTLERARYMIGIAAERARRRRSRCQGRLPTASFAASRWASCSPSRPGIIPYLIAVNSVVPAIMAGNAVLLKHSAQTPLCAERFAECFAGRGPAGRACSRCCICRTRTPSASSAIARVAFVAFTGLGGRRARGAARRRGALHRRRASSSAAAIRRTCAHDANLAPCDRESRGRRLLQQRPVLLRDPAHLCAPSRVRASSSTAAIALDAAISCSAIRRDTATTLGPAGATCGRRAVRRQIGASSVGGRARRDR